MRRKRAAKTRQRVYTGRDLPKFAAPSPLRRGGFAKHCSARYPDAGIQRPMTEMRLLFVGLIVVVLAAGAPSRTRGEDRPVVEDEFVVIPLRVHILSASELPEIDCRLSDGDVERILKKVNGIWHKAGIHWGLESLVREPAANPDRFVRLREIAGRASLEFYRILMPRESRGQEVVNLYYVHELPVNGVWLGSEAVVKETASLQAVEGGIDEPIPRASAHELGHSLGLPHRQARTNLLASGTTGTSLNATEIALARDQARIAPGAMSLAAVRQAAQTARRVRQPERSPAGSGPGSPRFPGAHADQARERLKAMPSDKAP